MRHLERLDEVDDRYAYYEDDEDDGPGSLLLDCGDEGGDTLIPPYEGTWTVLGEAESRDEAVEAARAWEEEAEGPNPTQRLLDHLTLTLADISDRSGIPLDTLKSWSSGRSTPRPESRRRLESWAREHAATLEEAARGDG